MTDEQALRNFIARYARPYDPENDTYDRPPFAADIKEGRNDPIYNAHSYHTKVPPRGIVPYILHYTEPGDLILDPFCGSGMTGVAALMCAQPRSDLLAQFPELAHRAGCRRTILTDLSPAACHIAANYITPVDVDSLNREYERIKAAVRHEFSWLYGTEHYEPAIGQYDPGQPAVRAQLTNAQVADCPSQNLFQEAIDRTWEVIHRDEVERRLGYSVSQLPVDKAGPHLDLVKVQRWICIPATIQYTVWSDVYRCEGVVTIQEATGKTSTRGKNNGKPLLLKKRVQRGCGREIVLWDAVRDSSDNARFSCPHCGQVWQKVQVQRVRSVPVITDLIHPKPDRGTRRLARPTSQRERDHIIAIEATPLPHWVPSGEIDPGREMMRHGLLKRGVRTLADFYTKRNLWALSALWAETEKIELPRLKLAARFLLTSFLPRVSRKAEYRTGGGAGNTHNINIPAIHREDNVLKSLGAKEGDILSAFRSLQAFHRGEVSSCAAKRDATRLEAVPDSAVDYVFTDPPFGSNVFYADCSILWESWLDDFTNEEQEIVVNERRQGGPFKTLDSYSTLITAAFKEMYRVLKPGRWATVVFNNSDGRVFEAIKKAVLEAGFQIANMLLLDRVQKTFKQVKGVTSGEDVVDKDVMFNLRKPSVGSGRLNSGNHDLERQIVDGVREHLKTLPGRVTLDPGKYSDDHRTTATINSMLMNTLIPQGVSVERLNLPFIERVCGRYFRKVGQRWYLRGERVGFSNGWPQLIEEEVAIRDEVSAIEWLRQHVKLRPMLLGELKPPWMRATGLLPAEISRGLVLEDVLAENFWRDPDTNRWREPTSEERERINDDRSIRVLHDAERCVAGSLRRSTDDSERCEWIDVIFDACKAIEEEGAAATPALRGFDPNEGYRIIGRLFQTVLRERVGPAAYGRAEKQARVASQRLARQAQQETTRAAERDAKDRGPTLFD